MTAGAVFSFAMRSAAAPVRSPGFSGVTVPAVVAIHRVKSDGRPNLGRELFAPLAAYGGVEALKFQSVIQPGAVLMLTLEHRPGCLSFAYESAAGRHASGRILLGTAMNAAES